MVKFLKHFENILYYLDYLACFSMFYVFCLLFSILKVGVSISEDSKKLLSDHGLVVRGFLDLRNVVDRVGRVYSW